MLGLGWPQWLLIIGLAGSLLLTFKVMARASVAYERARRAREEAARAALTGPTQPAETDEGDQR